MPHTTTRQHRTFHKGTWQLTPCTTTVTNPVGCHAPRQLCTHDHPTSHTGPIPVMTVMHWCWINTKIGYLQHTSGDLQEGCQWLTDGVPTGTPLYSPASLYHTMFHVPRVYNPAVGRTVVGRILVHCKTRL